MDEERRGEDGREMCGEQTTPRPGKWRQNRSPVSSLSCLLVLSLSLTLSFSWLSWWSLPTLGWSSASLIDAGNITVIVQEGKKGTEESAARGRLLPASSAHLSLLLLLLLQVATSKLHLSGAHER